MSGFHFPAYGRRADTIYKPTEVYVSLKFRVKSKNELPDYTRYVTEFVLDGNLERAENELEMCRFKLKEGARLRTEFDTVNLADGRDIQVAYYLIQGKEAIDYGILQDYIARKKQTKVLTGIYFWRRRDL